VSFKVVGIGEILWDLLPGGRQLGGAPANFAYHARALGAEARLISRVGDDALGREALDRLIRLGIPTDAIDVDPASPTGTAGIEVATDGQPRFQIHENVAWDALRGESKGRHAVADADAICFGTLGQRSEPARSSIRSLVAAAPERALRILDVNLRQQYFTEAIVKDSLEIANVLKVNDAELPHLADMFNLAAEDRTQMIQLAERFDLSCVACTRGSRGSLLFSAGTWSDHPGAPTHMVDTVGAGDSFAAAMTLGLLGGWDLDRINEHANRIAAYVCSCAGATPALPADLTVAFHAVQRRVDAKSS